MRAAQVLKVIGILQPGIIDSTFINEKFVFGEDDNYVIQTTTHDFTPVIEACHHHLVTQLNAFATTDGSTLQWRSGCPPAFAVEGKMIARKKFQLIVHTPEN